MRAEVVALALAFAVLVPLAGCLGSDDVDPTQVPESSTQEGDSEDPSAEPVQKSKLEGRVLTMDFEPIQGAKVVIAQGGKQVLETTSAENGRYAFTDVAPGPSIVQVSANCCKQGSFHANLRPGETHTLDARLEKYQSVLPYFVEDSWNGLVGCSGYFPHVGVFFNPQGACATTDPNNDPEMDFILEPSLQTVLVAMEWDAVATNPTGDLQLIMTNTTALSSDQRYFTLSGPSPLEIRLGPEDPEGGSHLYFHRIHEPRDSRFTVVAGEPAGFAYQQPFTVHYRFYYHEPAPEGASALPSE